jgi:Leishmanolysin
VLAEVPARGGAGNAAVLITPRALAAARAHVGCDTLAGVELEAAGGSGTAGALQSPLPP